MQRIRTLVDALHIPSNGEAWKHLDEVDSEFAAEPRNVQLGLCTDDFSLSGQLG